MHGIITQLKMFHLPSGTKQASNGINKYSAESRGTLPCKLPTVYCTATQTHNRYLLIGVFTTLSQLHRLRSVEKTMCRHVNPLKAKGREKEHLFC
jgi:hypothetical protein